MAAAGKPRRTGRRARSLPSRAEILEFVSSADGRVGRREIARAFNVRGADRMALKKILRDMAADGLFDGRKGLEPASGLPPVGVAEVVAIDTDGQVRVKPAGDGKAPASPIPLSALKRERLPALGPGDRVLVRYVASDTGADDEAAYEARLIRRLPQRQRRMVGIVSGPKGGPFRLEPVDRGGRDEIRIAPGDIEVDTGDLVTAELADGRRHEPRTARVVEHHGDASSPASVSLIAIHEHGIPFEFSQAALGEAAAARPVTLEGRADLTEIPLVTIDPADARDHDDAVHATPDTDPKNPDGWIVTVAIADVAHYVRPGSALDREARERGNSVYFPGRVVPMLPEALSSDLCSLIEGVDRAAFAVRMVFDAKGEMKRHSFSRAVIRSRATLSYVEVQDAIDGSPGDKAKPLVEPVIKPLWDAYRTLASARDRRGPLDLDLPERRIILDEEGAPVDVVTPPRLEAHRLIEEFMIQANVATAETLDQHRKPYLRRVHDAPAPEKVDALAAYLLSLELRLPKGQTLTPAHFNRLLDQAADTPHLTAVSDAVLRAQAQAHYAPRDVGHFGLNLRRYAHFTSPIRRYADIIAHRALISALAVGPDGLDRDTIAVLDEIGTKISEAERRAMAAERDTADRLIAQFLASRVGATFAGRVRGIVRSGLFVELDDTGANGFVAAVDLARDFGDRFFADEASRALVGTKTGTGFQLGDRVEVRLVGADALRGELDFEMLSEPQAVSGGRRPARGRRRQRARRSR